MLGKISEEENAGGRGMLSVVVCHRDGDLQPGPGFFRLVKKLGRDTSDKLGRSGLDQSHSVEIKLEPVGYGGKWSVIIEPMTNRNSRLSGVSRILLYSLSEFAWRLGLFVRRDSSVGS